MQRTTRHSVLLIEANPSLRRMITLGLQHRDLHTIEATAPASFPVSPSIVPDVIVLDIDGEAEIGQTLLTQAEAHPALSTLPIIALTWEKHFSEGMREGDIGRNPPVRVYLTKPFDARSLYAALEQLLLDVEESRLARKQENYLAARRATSAPSIWPLITAIGLLLAMIGLMLQITVTAIGLLIVMTALLCWTLGPKPDSLLFEQSEASRAA